MLQYRDIESSCEAVVFVYFKNDNWGGMKINSFCDSLVTALRDNHSRSAFGQGTDDRAGCDPAFRD